MSKQNFSKGSTILVLGHHDADGIVSASITSAFLRDQFPGAIIKHGTVDFHLQEMWGYFWKNFGQHGSTWGMLTPPDGVAVVDFPATWIPDENLVLYADHHASAFRSCGATDALKQVYDKHLSKGKLIFFDPHGKSCVSVLEKNLESLCGWTTPATLHEAIHLAHRIDQADYTSAKESVDYGNCKMSLFDALIPTLTQREAAISIDLLGQGASLEEGVFSPHREKVDSLIDYSKQVLGLIPSFVFPLGDYTNLIDWSHPDVVSGRPVRFAEYLNETVRYGVRLEMSPIQNGKDCLAKITLSRSPWASALQGGFCDPHFGRIAESLGGGGHSFAAGFRVRANSIEGARSKVLEILHQIMPVLKPLNPEHPFAE